MAAILVLVSVGAITALAIMTFTALVIGIRRGDRRNLANPPRSVPDAFARRVLTGVRYPGSTTEFTGAETEESE